jgi:hypothetical protein
MVLNQKGDVMISRQYRYETSCGYHVFPSWRKPQHLILLAPSDDVSRAAADSFRLQVSGSGRRRPIIVRPCVGYKCTGLRINEYTDNRLSTLPFRAAINLSFVTLCSHCSFNFQCHR